MKKIGIIVQRYGLEINGGAEYHARLIAEKICSDFSVEVFTSTALDYVTWKHHYPEGACNVNGITVNRFKVERERDPVRFGKIQEKVFNLEHSQELEEEWLEEEGPLMPALLQELDARENEFDYFIFFSYRYYHSYHGVRKFKKKAILVPTAEHDEVLYLRLFKDFFHLPGAIVYNSHEEKEIINRISGNHQVPGDIVGVGSEIPAEFSVADFRSRHGILGRYCVYIGRMDENKGVPELLDFFSGMNEKHQVDLDLVLIGKSWIEIPEHPRIRYLGFVTDQDKFNALKGAEFLIIPSQYESLSMVALEAWALGIPVVANGRTEVLQGQCKRSNAGLWYADFNEFSAVIRLLQENKNLREIMAQNGRRFFRQNYAWEVIKEKYIRIIENMENR